MNKEAGSEEENKTKHLLHEIWDIILSMCACVINYRNAFLGNSKGNNVMALDSGILVCTLSSSECYNSLIMNSFGD